MPSEKETFLKNDVDVYVTDVLVYTGLQAEIRPPPPPGQARACVHETWVRKQTSKLFGVLCPVNQYGYIGGGGGGLVVILLGVTVWQDPANVQVSFVINCLQLYKVSKVFSG